MIAEPLLAGATHDTDADAFADDGRRRGGRDRCPDRHALLAGELCGAGADRVLGRDPERVGRAVGQPGDRSGSVAVDANVGAGCATVPTNGVTTYPVIADPLSAGATHDTDAELLPGTAVGAAGAAGGPTVTAPLAALAGPVLLAFFAATRNV